MHMHGILHRKEIRCASGITLAACRGDETCTELARSLHGDPVIILVTCTATCHSRSAACIPRRCRRSCPRMPSSMTHAFRPAAVSAIYALKVAIHLVEDTPLLSIFSLQGTHMVLHDVRKRQMRPSFTLRAWRDAGGPRSSICTCRLNPSCPFVHCHPTVVA